VGVPRTVTVSLTELAGPSVTPDALTWVLVNVLVGEVVVVVDPVVDVEPPPVVAVVDVGRVSVPKRTVPMARSPAWSPMASTHVSPAASCVGVGGHGYLAASVAALVVVEHPEIAEVLGTTWVQVVGWPVIGGPTVPVVMVWVPASLPLLVPLLGIVTIASGEQLTGMSFPRKKITGCEGSELHCTIEARAPGEKPVPETLTTSPAASPEQMGADGLLSLHDAPAAVVVRDSVVVAAALMPPTLVATIAPPAITATTPTVVRTVISRECRNGRGAAMGESLPLCGPATRRRTLDKPHLSLAPAGTRNN
jgi:hypothetical protein